jgi:hypothetical protein
VARLGGRQGRGGLGEQLVEGGGCLPIAVARRMQQPMAALVGGRHARHGRHVHPLQGAERRQQGVGATAAAQPVQ